MTSTDVSSERLDLLAMSLGLMEALLAGDRERAQSMAGYRIPQDWPSGMESTLRFRIAIAVFKFPRKSMTPTAPAYAPRRSGSAAPRPRSGS